MKCPNCLYESEQDFIFCPKCGVQVQSEQVQPQIQPIFMPNINPAASRLLPLLKDNMFLAICVLVSVWTLLSFDVISILLTIFLWLTFAKSRKNIVDTKHLRQISGTIYASYVINNVASIIIIVCGAIYIGLMGYAMSVSLVEFEQSLRAAMDTALNQFPFKDYLPSYSMVTVFLGIGIGMLLGGITTLLINVLGFRKIHRFVKSVYMGIDANSYELAYLSAAKNWLIYFAVVKCIGTVFALAGGLTALITGGVQAATIIIAVILIKKYLLANNYQI